MSDDDQVAPAADDPTAADLAGAAAVAAPGLRAARPRLGWVAKSWIVGIVVFSLLRAVPVAAAFDSVNIWLFLVLDVATAFPYAYGQVRLVTDIRARRYASAQMWAVVVAVMFLAPYALVATQGAAELGTFGWSVLALLVVVFAAVSVARIVSQVRRPSPTTGS